MRKSVLAIVATATCVQAAGPVEKADMTRDRGREIAASAVSGATPGGGARQFNLDCVVYGRELADIFPESRPMTPTPEREWQDSFTYMVDLEAMLFCSHVSCRNLGPRPIADLDPHHERIMFYDRPGFRSGFSLRYSQYLSVREDLGRVTLEKGTCTRERFSGFPAYDPEPGFVAPAG